MAVNFRLQGRAAASIDPKVALLSKREMSFCFFQIDIYYYVVVPFLDPIYLLLLPDMTVLSSSEPMVVGRSFEDGPFPL